MNCGIQGCGGAACDGRGLCSKHAAREVADALALTPQQVAILAAEIRNALVPVTVVAAHPGIDRVLDLVDAIIRHTRHNPAGRTRLRRGWSLVGVDVAGGKVAIAIGGRQYVYAVDPAEAAELLAEHDAQDSRIGQDRLLKSFVHRHPRAA